MSCEIPHTNRAPGSLGYERRYGQLSDQQKELAFAGQELSATMDRLSAESVDATPIGKELLHTLPHGGQDPSPAELTAANARLEAWRAEQLAARDGKGFIARVPTFSIWRGSAEPVHSYLAVDADTPLTVNADAVGNMLRRDYVTGAHLYSDEDHAKLQAAFNPQDEIAEQLRERPRSYDPKITWAEFGASVGDLTSRLASYPDITGVVGPSTPTTEPNQNA